MTHRLAATGAALLLMLAGAATPGPASELTRPVRERFAAEDVTEVPDFQRHVLPLMGRLGCNGRACHGSFQGQGGFRLSLFGYDFKSDHEALLKDGAGRVVADNPDASKVLQKPTLAIPHKGGKRMDEESWQYRTLLALDRIGRRELLRVGPVRGARSAPGRDRLPPRRGTGSPPGHRPLGRRHPRGRHVHQPLPHQRRVDRRGERGRRRHEQGEWGHARRRLLRQRRGGDPGARPRFRPGRPALPGGPHPHQDRRTGGRQAPQARHRPLGPLH